MPQSPGTYKYLTERQRYIAAERLRRESLNVRMPLAILNSEATKLIFH